MSIFMSIERIYDGRSDEETRPQKGKLYSQVTTKRDSDVLNEQYS